MAKQEESSRRPRKTIGEKRSSEENRRPSSDRPTRDNSGERSFNKSDKPYSERPRRENSGERSFDKPRGERNFNKSDKPYSERPARANSGERSFDKPRGERSFTKTDKPYSDKPRRENSGERNFDKPRGERSFNKSDKPYSERPPRENSGERNFNKSDKPYSERPRRENSGERSFDKPRGERNFNKSDKPYSERPRRENSGERNFNKSDKPYSERPPRDNSGERNFDKPRGERNFNKSDKPYSERPRRENSGERNSDQPRGERNFNASDRKPFERKPFERKDDRSSDKKETPSRYGKRSEKDQTRRQPGRTRPGFVRDEPSEEKSTPTYNIGKYKENAPDKIRKKIDKVESEKTSDTVRLNRYIALSGVCSRRDADVLIEAGEISVNGKVITELGFQVKPNEVVRYGRRILNPEKMVYVLLNKPKDFITTVEDDMDRRTVMELVKEAASQRIYPVGRLDRNTTGLLLLTNDGELADKLTHPSNQIEKIYQVEIDKPITTEDFEAIKKGVELEDGFIKPDEVSIITPDAQVVGIRIHSGRNRIVRRVFEKFGYDVTKLDRTVFAGLNKKELPRGQWRYLTEKEVIRLKYLV